MPKCTYHPNVDTDLSCTECGKPICPKDMVETPVGYKCRDCARPSRSQYAVVKPGQLLRASIVGGVVGVFGGVILSFIPLLGIFSGLIWGLATAEAARRASGGHREWAVGIVAIVAILIGGFVVPIVIGFGPGIIAVVIAIVAALIDLALLEFR
jgi:hypothetical protein